MKIVVIGAGVIGVSAALEIQRRGAHVTILDRDGVASGASKGNAGAFAFTDTIPLATPGIMAKAPRWLLDPLGPLAIPPAYAFSIVPWLLRFWRASWPDRYGAALRAQSAMMSLSSAALERQVSRFESDDLLCREGQLQLYDGEARFKASLPSWDERQEGGVRFEHIAGPEAIAERQPGIAPRFTHATFTPDWINTVDPALWVERLAERFVERGGTIARRAVMALHPAEGAVTVVTETGEMTADQVVVAAGAWSKALTGPLGHALPLETERGYNTTLPAGAFDLRMQLTFSDHAFVVSHLGEGVRVGGAVELGGLKLAPNMKRADTLLAKAKTFLPGLDVSGGEQWMGFRPSMPDSLPVISKAPGIKGLIYAFGHGHLGLTQAAGTAEIVADLVTGATPAIDIAPYRAERFL